VCLPASKNGNRPWGTMEKLTSLVLLITRQVKVPAYGVRRFMHLREK
jgi:hypothetical protein